MVIDMEKLKHMLKTVCLLLQENEGELTEIDTKIGDGDHGVTIVKLTHIIEEICKKEQENIETLFDDLGTAMTNSRGGSAGPLWGTFFEGMGIGAKNMNAIDSKGLKKILEAGFENLDDISGAKVGDKTMMDAVIPATKAAMACEGEIGEILELAAKAAQKGAEDTINYIAKFGRAKNLKERAIGYKDAGAVSMALFYRGLANGGIE